MSDLHVGLQNFAQSDCNVLFVCLMGIATVFLGLICLIIICKVFSIVRAKEEQPTQSIVSPVASAHAPAESIENKQELIAAISAAVAEELGTDVIGIRITSINKIL